MLKIIRISSLHIILFSILSGLTFSQTIFVNPPGVVASNLEAENLLREILLAGGECADINGFRLKENSSAPFPFANRSWGYFERGDSDFPFEKGIVLTSGFAVDAIGPSEQGNLSQGTLDWLGDADADALAGIGTYNATVFEFDFIPQGNTVSFNYIFASDEYPEWSCSQYNDVFGFIISGPGIVNDPGLNGKNIALLPNGLPVTINNVNDQHCGDDTFYVSGEFQDIGYDGRTTVLTAFCEVIPGETYHIRLLVADSSDERFDSAVFLEAGSFNLGMNIVDEFGVDVGESKFFCGLSQYTLYLAVNDPRLVIQWYKDGEIIPGATEVSFTATESGLYSVRVSGETCTSTDAVLLTFDTLLIDAGKDFSLCNQQAEIILSYQPLGEMSFSWELNGELIPGENEDRLVVTEPGVYTVTAISSLGCTGTDSVVVTQGNGFAVPFIEIGLDHVGIRVVDGVEPYQYSLDGESWQDDHYFYNLPPGRYTVYVKSADGCLSTADFTLFGIPTLFTPNGDGINDVWRIKGLEDYKNVQVLIFDRYGRKVFESTMNHSNIVWDGFFSNGKKAPTQDYWYILKVDESRIYTGSITVKSRTEKGE